MRTQTHPPPRERLLRPMVSQVRAARHHHPTHQTLTQEAPPIWGDAPASKALTYSAWSRQCQADKRLAGVLPTAWMRKPRTACTKPNCQ